jgi:hypothetical protein
MGAWFGIGVGVATPKVAYSRVHSPSSRGELARSQLALSLDRSEKVALSYALGQELTAIVCSHLLSVRLLMHVDRYAARFAVNFGASQRRGDLFGQNVDDAWIVAEAKGRSNSIEDRLRETLTAQKRSVASVSGVPLALSLGCVVSFPPSTKRLQVDVFDPEGDDVQVVELEVDSDRYLLAYFEPFVAAVDAGAPDTEVPDNTVAARLGPSGLRVGLLRGIAEAVRQVGPGDPAGIAATVTSELARARNLVGLKDGTIVEAGWSSALAVGDWEVVEGHG